MIPLRDDIPAQKAPVVTVALIILNAGIFVMCALLQSGEYEGIVFQYGFIPAKVFKPAAVVGFYAREMGVLVPDSYGLGESLIPAFTCMFLHAGWLHMIGNMWMLWIFGDNVEDCFGHVGFLLFYLACGLASSVAQAISAPFSPIPMVGASGAIAGVMGAYLLLYPRARVLTLVWIIIVVDFWPIPAFVFLFYWFAIQVFSGVGTLAAGGMGGGVAWWAHIGGFAMGFALVLVTGVKPLRRPPLSYAYLRHAAGRRRDRIGARRVRR